MMEDAEWDDANKEKVRLEEKQRGVRRAREEEANRVRNYKIDTSQPE